ncbi:MAG: transcriptional regulator NrdR, partial [Thiobacillaceae bacterium]|nr:transcriptional regulator NrdR [Thiobacillaceae bacterium]MCX7673524.1 transcriptional regulator NrdR [Thiobacillaceae bacterium]MDW8324242.1 transcriptional regulator NrdR [Burkholderiales bacterium]
MKCPFCGHPDTQVAETRLSEDGATVRRRRRCPSCDRRFTTYETADVRAPAVVKRDGERQEFSLQKLREGFRRALHKRPVPTQQVEAAIERVYQRLLSLGEREVPSRLIGDLVMAELKRLDTVAYIRFASVYKSFQDVEDFRDAIREVGGEGADDGGAG